MFHKTIKTAALVLGMTASSVAFAGGNTTPNAPSTPPAAVLAAAITANTGVQVNVTLNASGDYIITNASTGAVLATVSSAFIAGLLAAY